MLSWRKKKDHWANLYKSNNQPVLILKYFQVDERSFGEKVDRMAVTQNGQIVTINAQQISLFDGTQRRFKKQIPFRGKAIAVNGSEVSVWALKFGSHFFSNCCSDRNSKRKMLETESDPIRLQIHFYNFFGLSQPKWIAAVLSSHFDSSCWHSIRFVPFSFDRTKFNGLEIFKHRSESTRPHAFIGALFASSPILFFLLFFLPAPTSPKELSMK